MSRHQRPVGWRRADATNQTNVSELVYSSKPIERAVLHPSEARTIASTGRATAKVRLRARVCPALLLASDIAAFAVAAFLAFVVDISPGASPYTRAIESLTTLGAGWHGWGSLLVLVSLLSYFGARGHYTTRVPSWTQLSDTVIA